MEIKLVPEVKPLSVDYFLHARNSAEDDCTVATIH